MRTSRVLVVVFALALVGAACARAEAQSIELVDPPDTIQGNVLTLPVNVEGIDIVPPDGDTSGDSGHFHAFIDREPSEVGDVMPMEGGVVHTADNPIVIYGLSVGAHEITVVVGDGTHTRFGAGLEESITVEVEGPSVQGSAPATLDEGEDLTVSLSAEGVELTPADGDTSGDSGHLHVLVDPDTPPRPGETIPEPVENRIIHTVESSATISGLEPGQHTIWVVLGNGVHEAFDPPVMDRLTVTVG